MPLCYIRKMMYEIQPILSILNCSIIILLAAAVVVSPIRRREKKQEIEIELSGKMSALARNEHTST